MDVDDEQAHASTRTGQLIGRAQAITTHGRGYHVVIDARAVPQADWPRQGPYAGGDIKSCGFIPVPGSTHWDGQRYELVPGWRPVPATPQLMAAISSDLAGQREHSRAAGGGNGGGGTGGGHDGEVAAEVLRMVLRGMSKEQCYAEWLKIAVPRDPDDPFTWDDFERHYGDESQGALAKAMKRRADEERGWQEAAAWLTGGRPAPAAVVRRASRRTDPTLLATATRWLQGGGA